MKEATQGATGILASFMAVITLQKPYTQASQGKAKSLTPSAAKLGDNLAHRWLHW
jgi:hypothetical protein